MPRTQHRGLHLWRSFGCFLPLILKKLFRGFFNVLSIICFVKLTFALARVQLFSVVDNNTTASQRCQICHFKHFVSMNDRQCASQRM